MEAKAAAKAAAKAESRMPIKPPAATRNDVLEEFEARLRAMNGASMKHYDDPFWSGQQCRTLRNGG